jgi:localization factor PodJL
MVNDIYPILTLIAVLLTSINGVLPALIPVEPILQTRYSGFNAVFTPYKLVIMWTQIRQGSDSEMASTGPWSVKGIDPKARAAAKEAAQRQGMTLGEWLSKKMLEADTAMPTRSEPSAPANGQYDQNYIPGVASSGLFPGRGEHRPAGDGHLFGEIESLARRLEATEHRSTLAITGIDQSVLGLLARLEGVEKSQNDVGERLNQTLETLDARLAQADDDASEFSLKFNRELKDAARRIDEEARRIDTVSEQNDVNVRLIRHEVDKDVELINNRSDEISQRLAMAERQTDNAIKTLEASFVSVDERMKQAEGLIRDNSDSGLSEKFDQRFAMISNELVKVVAETRGQLAAQIEAQAANPKLDQLEDGLDQIRGKFAQTEKRHADTLEQIAIAVSKLGNAVESRLAQTEAHTDSRLEELQQEQASALEGVGRSMTEVAERLEARFEQQDARLEAQLQQEKDQAAENDLESRLRDSEARTGQLVEEALQRVHQRLDDAADQNAASISPVQRSLNNLTERLATIEERSTPPFADLTHEQSQNLSDHGTTSADGSEAPQLGSFPDDGELVVPPEQEYVPNHTPEADYSNFDQPGLPPLGGASGYDADPYGAPAQYVPEGYQGGSYPTAEASQTMGATANSDFLAAARRSMQENSAESSQPIYPAGPAAPGAAELAPPKGRSRSLMIAASVFALVAIGAAVTVTMVDFGGKEPAIPMAQNDYPQPQANDPFLNGSANTPADNMNGVEPTGTENGEPAPADAPPQYEPVEQVSTREAVPVQTPPAATPKQTRPAPKAQPKPTRQAASDGAYQPPAQTEAKPPARRRPSVVAPKPTQVSTRPASRPTVTPAVVDPNAPISLSHKPAPATNGRVSMEQAARAGDPIALYQYASSLVDSGRPQEAAQAMQQAAEKGLPAAQYQLAKYYENGTGVTPDARQSKRWTERAANGGNRRAMHNLAMFHAEGRSVEQSYENAAKWFEEAALLGLANSQFNLALLYEQGLGVPKSLPDAFAWYSIAAKAGDRGAAQKIEALRKQLPAEAVTEAETITARFRPRPLDLAANGVFRNVNWARPQVNDPTSISRAQILLARLGYKPGPADGSIGEQTRLAVISYERDNGLAQTGLVDAKLLSKLEQSAVN